MDTLLVDQEELEVVLAVSVHLGIVRRYRTHLHVSYCGARPHYRGSVQGRRRTKHRDSAFGVAFILRVDFGVHYDPPVYSDADFERRFRVPRSAFVRIYSAVRDRPWWWL